MRSDIDKVIQHIKTSHSPLFLALIKKKTGTNPVFFNWRAQEDSNS